MIFDLEANGLNPTKIYCISYEDKDKSIKTVTNYDDMRKLILSAKELVGHNIICFDIPVIERILGIKVKARLVDTLALSWYLYPERHLHGLDSWGKDVGVDKPPIDDWEGLTLEEYCHRCEEDVDINRKMYAKCLKYLDAIYDGDYKRLVNYLSFKMYCARLQQESRWKLDVDRVRKTIDKLSAEKEKRVEQLAEVMPMVPVISKRTRPAKPFKKDGTPSTTGARWFSLLKEKGLPKDFNGEIEVVTSYKEPNPGSYAQVKDWLYSLGWKPETFKYDRNKQTNEIRKIEQINLPQGQGVCPSIKKLYEKEPNLEALDGLSILNHRIPALKSFIKNEEDGWVVARIHGLTNTLRFQHASPCVNLPGVDKAYGEDIRGCLIAPEGYELLGSDQSSLEDRTKQHYMWKHDPEYVKEMNTPGFDPHLDIGVESGMLTQQQADDYKNGDKTHHNIRHAAKQVNYSCTYGVTPEGLVRNTGMPLKDAKLLHKTYWRRNWSLEAIANDCEVKTVFGKKWLYNPVSKLYYSLRFDKDRFSTLNQGTGVYCFDAWVREVLDRREQITAQFHDEIVLCVKKGEREELTKLLKDCVKIVNKKLKLNRDLDVDVQFGENYAEIH